MAGLIDISQAPNQRAYSGRAKKPFSQMGSKNLSSPLLNPRLVQASPTSLVHIDGSNQKHQFFPPKAVLGFLFFIISLISPLDFSYLNLLKLLLLDFFCCVQSKDWWVIVCDLVWCFLAYNFVIRIFIIILSNLVIQAQNFWTRKVWFSWEFYNYLNLTLTKLILSLLGETLS